MSKKQTKHAVDILCVEAFVYMIKRKACKNQKGKSKDLSTSSLIHGNRFITDSLCATGTGASLL